MLMTASISGWKPKMEMSKTGIIAAATEMVGSMVLKACPESP